MAVTFATSPRVTDVCSYTAEHHAEDPGPGMFVVTVERSMSVCESECSLVSSKQREGKPSLYVLSGVCVR